MFLTILLLCLVTPRAAWCSSGCDLECFLASLCAWVPPFVRLVPGLVTGARYAAEEPRASGFQLAKGFPAQNQAAGYQLARPWGGKGYEA